MLKKNTQPFAKILLVFFARFVDHCYNSMIFLRRLKVRCPIYNIFSMRSMRFNDGRFDFFL